MAERHGTKWQAWQNEQDSERSHLQPPTQSRKSELEVGQCQEPPKPVPIGIPPSSKAVPSITPQTAPPAGNQAFKSLSLGGVGGGGGDDTFLIQGTPRADKEQLREVPSSPCD